MTLTDLVFRRRAQRRKERNRKIDAIIAHLEANMEDLERPTRSRLAVERLYGPAK